MLRTKIVERYCSETPLLAGSLADMVNCANAQMELTRQVETIVEDDVAELGARRLANRFVALLRLLRVQCERLPENGEIAARRELCARAYFEQRKEWLLPVVATYGLAE